MQTLSFDNADVTITSPSVGTQQLVTNVTFQYSNRPVELDTPAGAYWIWPLRRGELTLDYLIGPGQVNYLPSIASSLLLTEISFTSKLQDGNTVTMTVSGYNSAVRIGAQNVGGDPAMPTLGVQQTYIVFIDDDGETGSY
jgi:hypothetical protein